MINDMMFILFSNPDFFKYADFSKISFLPYPYDVNFIRNLPSENFRFFYRIAFSPTTAKRKTIKFI